MTVLHGRDQSICLNTHEWRVGVHDLIRNEPIGGVQHMLHHKPPIMLPFGLDVRGSLQYASPFNDILFPRF